MGVPHEQGTRMGVPLPKIVQWFKTMTTNEYLRMAKDLTRTPIGRRLWQRNYYEHIIRIERSLNAIREYIWANPSQWGQDPDNPESGGINGSRQRSATEFS